MKRRKIAAAMLALSLCFCGCDVNSADRGKEITYEPPTPERYTNCIEIEGQWGASGATGPNGQYGMGDPFVMRYNGKYYLYPSTSDPCDGIKVFESDDLVNWTYRGLAVAEDQPTSHGAYAPEVVYYNGWFYMCQSRAGKGHYIYRSRSPIEGFTLFSTSDEEREEEINIGNLGKGIDGSFYVGDDGKLYLLHTSTPAGLKYNEILDPEDIRPSTLGRDGELGEANLRHWIEGPGTFRRGEYSYLTYTGNHVISKGYRIAYSYARNLKSLSDFIQPVDNVTIMDTDPDHYGLGHSSNAVGPNLDSVYTAYHSLVGNGPARRYNLDRYFAVGGLVTANGVTHRAVAVPDKPDARAKNGTELTEEGGIYSVGNADGYFTAEYNFTPVEGQKLCFGGTNGKYVCLTDDGIALYSGNGSLIKSKEVNYPADRLNVVRIENGDGVGYVYLNGMRLIEYEATAVRGAVGYSKREGVEFTAVTNDVFGTSDFEALKNFPTRFPAATYLKGENRGYKIAGAKRVKGGVRVGEKQSVKYIEEEELYAVSLKKGDWVKYGADIGSKGVYSLTACVTRASVGAKLKITVGESTLETTLSAGAREGDTVRVNLGRMEIKAGVTAMKVEVLSGKPEIVWFEASAAAEDNDEVDFGDFELFGNARQANGRLSLEGGTPPAAALWGNAGICDFEASITFDLEENNNNDLGIMIRANHYSYYRDQPLQSWRGYYLTLGTMLTTLKRYDYGDETLASDRHGLDLGEGEHTVTVRGVGDRITVSIDGNKYIDFCDPNAFLGGRIGVYCASGRIDILGVTYTAL